MLKDQIGFIYPRLGLFVASEAGCDFVERKAMYKQCKYDWARLAPYWELFENRGLNPALLKADQNLLSPNVGIIGCGRGTVVRFLQGGPGPGQKLVIGYDTCPTMTSVSRRYGCEHIYDVVPGGDLPRLRELDTVIVATGVFEPMERHEVSELIHHISWRAQPSTNLWIYLFGRFGPDWNFAVRMGAVGQLGISNQRLFDFYEEVQDGAFDAVSDKLQLNHEERLYAQICASGIDRFVSTVAQFEQVDKARALSIVREMLPQVTRHFSSAEIKEITSDAELDVLSTRQFPVHGVVRLVMCPRAA